MKNTKENELIYEAYEYGNRRQPNKNYKKGQPEEVILDDGTYKAIKINSINSATHYSQNTLWHLKDRRMARQYLQMPGNLIYISKNDQPVAMAWLPAGKGPEESQRQILDPNGHIIRDPEILQLIDKIATSEDIIFDPKVMQDLF